MQAQYTAVLYKAVAGALSCSIATSGYKVTFAVITPFIRYMFQALGMLSSVKVKSFLVFILAVSDCSNLFDDFGRSLFINYGR